MPKLRDDLLRNLAPDDQALMKLFRKTPLKAYTLKELLPQKSSFPGELDETFLRWRLDSLISQSLVMKIFYEGQTYYAKAKGRAPSRPSNKAPSR
jgi:hypothetical protein